MTKKSLENLRDCVRQAFENGSKRGEEFHKMRHSITTEFKRLGYSATETKEKLSEWNGRCERPLNSKKVNDQLFKYVDWAFEKDAITGCGALESYCLGERNCQYHLRTTAKNRERTAKAPFNFFELKKYLEDRFKAKGVLLNCVLDALLWHQKEEATGEIIIVGLRKIASLIQVRHTCTLAPEEVRRLILVLCDEGVLEKVVQGKSGQFTQKANGYRFLAWEQHTESDCNP